VQYGRNPAADVRCTGHCPGFGQAGACEFAEIAMARRVHRERPMTNTADKPSTLPFLSISGAELVALLRPHQVRRIRRELARAQRSAARAAATQVSPQMPAGSVQSLSPTTRPDQSSSNGGMTRPSMSVKPYSRARSPT
jgi:hypothetical protein